VHPEISFSAQNFHFGAFLIKSSSLQKQLDVNNTLSFEYSIFFYLTALVNIATSFPTYFFFFYQDELEWGKENCIQIKRIREVNTAHKCANFVQNLL